MRNLLSANLGRLGMNKSFWIIVILLISVESLSCMISFEQSIPMDYTLFISLQVIGILVSIFFSLFLGTEYSDGTIRNKIIVGHKRSAVYLASFITGIVAVTIFYLVGVLTGCIFGIVLLEPASNSLSSIMVTGVVGWLACISYIAIFNIVGMLSSSKARTSIICILIAFFLMIVGLAMESIIGQGFLAGNAKVIAQFLMEFSPFGQTIQTIRVQIDSPLKLITYALLLSSLLTILGLFGFQKKDLK